MSTLLVIAFLVLALACCGLGALAAHTFEERLKQKIEYDERLKEAAEWFTRHIVDGLKQETSKRAYALESEKATYAREKVAYLAARDELQQLIDRGIWTNPNVWVDTASQKVRYDTRAPQKDELQNSWEIFIRCYAVPQCQLRVAVCVDIHWRAYGVDDFKEFELKRTSEWVWEWYATDKEALVNQWDQFPSAQYLMSRSMLLTHLSTRAYKMYAKHFVTITIHYTMKHKKLEDESC